MGTYNCGHGCSSDGKTASTVTLAARWAIDGKHISYLVLLCLQEYSVRSFTTRNAASGIIRIEADYYFIYDIKKNSIPFPTQFFTLTMCFILAHACSMDSCHTHILNQRIVCPWPDILYVFCLGFKGRMELQRSFVFILSLQLIPLLCNHDIMSRFSA